MGGIVNFRHLTITAFCLAALGLASQGFAASGYGSWQAPEQQNLGMQIYNQQSPQPQLTPEQYDLAARLYSKTAQDMAEIRQELAAKVGLLDEELAKITPDKAKIERLSSEIGTLRGRLLAAGAELRAKLAGNGLPPDCLGPCYSSDGYRHGMMGGCWNGGWSDGYHHGGRRGHWGGHWNGWHGMMGNW